MRRGGAHLELDHSALLVVRRQRDGALELEPLLLGTEPSPTQDLRGSLSDVPSDLTAKEILVSCAVTYATCRSYEDSGEHTTVFVKGPRSWNRHTTIQRFRTAFVRPDRFLFEFAHVAVGPEQEWTRAVCWNDGKSIRSWSTLAGEEKTHESLPMALGSSGGISGGVSLFSPRLLLPTQETKSPLPEEDRARLIGRERIDAFECFILEGPFREDTVRLAIDCQSFLIRRRQADRAHTPATHDALLQSMRKSLGQMSPDDPHRATAEQSIKSLESMTSTDFTTQSTTVWHPTLDPELDASVFEFHPPTD